jgi:DNA-binding transcriptional LysR family regulator
MRWSAFSRWPSCGSRMVSRRQSGGTFTSRQRIAVVICFPSMENGRNLTHTPAWDDLRVLLALHRQGSFLGAGKAIGISTSTAARRIEALEAGLGRPLVHRTNGGTLLEPDALPLVRLAEQLELGLHALRRDDTRDPFAGTVRISLSEGFARPVTQCLCELRRAHPALRFEILSEARRVDLARREADIALRTGSSGFPALIERRLGRVGCGLYAAPSYVERRLHTARLKIADLERHDAIGWEKPGTQMMPMNWLASHGAKRFVFRSNSYQAILEATLQGQGIAVLHDSGERSLPGLVRLEIDAELPHVLIYLVYHRDIRRLPRVRLVVDALIASLRGTLKRVANV